MGGEGEMTEGEVALQVLDAIANQRIFNAIGVIRSELQDLVGDGHSFSCIEALPEWNAIELEVKRCLMAAGYGQVVP